MTQSVETTDIFSLVLVTLVIAIGIWQWRVHSVTGSQELFENVGWIEEAKVNEVLIIGPT